jgi:hypothetical protein
MISKSVAKVLDCSVSREPGPHMLTLIQDLGIKYQHSISCMMTESWRFFNCTNLPKILPDWIDKYNSMDLYDLVGYGLDTEEAAKLEAGWKIIKANK